MIELAVLMPVFLLLLLSALDFSWILVQRLVVADAAAKAVRAAAVRSCDQTIARDVFYSSLPIKLASHAQPTVLPAMRSIGGQPVTIVTFDVQVPIPCRFCLLSGLLSNTFDYSDIQFAPVENPDDINCQPS